MNYNPIQMVVINQYSNWTPKCYVFGAITLYLYYFGQKQCANLFRKLHCMVKPILIAYGACVLFACMNIA